MKALAIALASACFAFGVVATAAEPTASLTGIALVRDKDVVLLEIKRSGIVVQRPILEVGDRIEGIEIVSIDPRTATASLKQGGEVTAYSVGTDSGTGTAPTVNLREADSRQVLELCQKVSGLTVIASPALPPARITVRSEDGAVGALARALSDQGIAVTPRYGKFAFATTKSGIATLDLIKSPPETQVVPKAERFPAGLIKFVDADVAQVLDIYQELTGRTLILSPVLPPAKLTFRSETEITRDEAIWLSESVLHLAGIAATKPFDKFAFVTPLSDAPQVAQIEAPPAPPKDANVTDVEQFPPGLIKFNQGDLSQVLDIYQELTGRTVLKSPSLPHVKITVKSQTVLTRGEAIWLLEAKLRLAGIAAAPRFDKYAFATPLAYATRVAQIKQPPPADPNAERFPPGLIRFAEADLNQVLDIYQELTGGKVHRADALPSPKTTLRSQTELTRDEVVWLLESALQLGGIRFVPAGDNEVTVLPETSLKAANN